VVIQLELDWVCRRPILLINQQSINQYDMFILSTLVCAYLLKPLSLIHFMLSAKKPPRRFFLNSSLFPSKFQAGKAFMAKNLPTNFTNESDLHTEAEWRVHRMDPTQTHHNSSSRLQSVIGWITSTRSLAKLLEIQYLTFCG
jgi:hypothetical protein